MPIADLISAATDAAQTPVLAALAIWVLRDTRRTYVMLKSLRGHVDTSIALLRLDLADLRFRVDQLTTQEPGTDTPKRSEVP